ncbi:MAG: dephospho-CoA kinase [Candidatus Nanopelagicales bacterium]|nr:dephospho-CoA kinase [Candidatus Nanopelagicales bacterium]MDZ4250510.1 dephospho-CoA kinase [Candidatus Nanopelagicales bacterium]
MTRVALTGEIGSGKSTVARWLADRGAVVVDADQLARELVEPGRPALAEIVEQFGGDVIRPDGTLDRASLAAVVFNDPVRLLALNQIMHPRIAVEAERRLAEVPVSQVALYDTPLLAETDPDGEWDFVIVVEAPRDARLERLVEFRGMARDDALARIAARDSERETRVVADIVIRNDSGLDRLRECVDEVWARISGAEIN